jgi:1-acyl-sn-glycerol-3-phosphate acyltransferase
VVVFRSLLGISWMWFFGAVFLSQFPSFARDVLHGNEQVASLLLVVFSIGIGTGALLCEMLSRRHVEIGLVPLGAIGMTVFAVDLYFASRGLPAPPAALTLGSSSASRRTGACWPTWPAVAVRRHLQRADVRADPDPQPAHAPRPHHRGQQHPQRAVHDRQLAGRRALLLAAGFSGPAGVPGRRPAQRGGGLLHLPAGARVPAALRGLRATRTVYRFKVRGDEHIPPAGAAILVCNHVSFVDAVLLMAASPRPIRFIMDHRIFATPVLGTLFRLAKASRSRRRRKTRKHLRGAFAEARQVLAEGDLLCIFPEGGITRDGQLAEPFKGGIRADSACVCSRRSSPGSSIHKSCTAGPVRASSRSTKWGPPPGRSVGVHKMLPGWQSPCRRSVVITPLASLFSLKKTASSLLLCFGLSAIELCR